jgi:cobalamin transport system substrate-binding protein
MKRITMLLTVLMAVVLAGCTAAATPTPSELPVPTVVVPTAEPTAVPPTEVPAFPVTLTDGLGNEVTVDAKPEKIVSLTLGTDEILLDLVGPERLIGVTYLAADETTSNIASNPELAKVKNTVEADPEVILALEPDLVLVGSFTKPEVIDQLKSAGVTVFVVGNFTAIQPMADNILTLGKLVGEPEKAQAMVDKMNTDLTAVTDKVAVADARPTVLYYTSGGWVAGSKTTVDDIITQAGGVNAAADLVDWNVLSPEAVIEKNPDVVILSPYVTDDEFLKNPAFAGLNAVKNKKVVALTDAHMSATSQYIVLAVLDVAKLLHPDLVQ